MHSALAGPRSAAALQHKPVLLHPNSHVCKLNQLQHSEHRQWYNVKALAGGGEGGIGGGGGARGGGSNGRFGPQGSPQPADDNDRQQRSWLHMLAFAGGSYVLLGLLQPWRLLQPQQQIDTSQHSVAIVIPVLNESAGIVATLEQLRQLQPPAADIIVVDGGSTDNTVQLVRKSGLATRVLTAGRGRAVQMNAGAGAATADMLCFLHGDTSPPRDLVFVMRRELSDPRTVLAGFMPSIEVPDRRLWLMSAHNFFKTYYAPLLFRPLSYLRGLRILFGDQTLFCRAHDFRAVGGFDASLSIMEDADLCVRMHQAGPAQQQQQQGSSASTSSSRAATKHQRFQPFAAAAAAQSTGPAAPPQPAAAALLHAWQCWCQPRGRVKQVLDRVSVTSGRRIEAWGSLKATYIHMLIGTAWYLGQDPQNLRELYVKLYTDSFR